MKRDKEQAQALVEFILILPILLFLIMGLIDFGRIIYAKINVGSNLAEIIDKLEGSAPLTQTLEEYSTSTQTYSYQKSEDNYVTINAQEKISFITPGLALILDDPYLIKEKRMIRYEKVE